MNGLGRAKAAATGRISFTNKKITHIEPKKTEKYLIQKYLFPAPSLTRPHYKYNKFYMEIKVFFVNLVFCFWVFFTSSSSPLCKFLPFRFGRKRLIWKITGFHKYTILFIKNNSNKQISKYNLDLQGFLLVSWF